MIRDTGLGARLWRIAVWGIMSVLCGLHCLRRVRMRRELGADYRSSRTGRAPMPLVRHCSFSGCGIIPIIRYHSQP